MDWEECRREATRLKHHDDCEGEILQACSCGCGRLQLCPGWSLCRTRILELTGLDETKAVKAWMKLGLCICEFVIKNRDRLGVWSTHSVALGDRPYRPHRMRSQVMPIPRRVAIGPLTEGGNSFGVRAVRISVIK